MILVDFYNVVIFALLNYMHMNSILHNVTNNYYPGLITKLADTRSTVGVQGPKKDIITKMAGTRPTVEHKAPVNNNGLANTRLIV
jgi:hypothetical protein